MLAFQKQIADFENRDILLVAASVDDRPEAEKLVKDLALTFPVGCGLNARQFSEKTGAFYHRDEGYLHASGFLLDREGRVANAAYSTYALGRLVPGDCLSLIDYLDSQ